MSDVIAEERTTLPEGATVSVSRVQRPKLGPITELRAWMGNNIVKMRADDITPQNLRWYLDRCVTQINRERQKLTVKPGMVNRSPKNFTEFTSDMAFYGMFIFDVKALDLTVEPEKKPKKQRRRKAKKEKAVTVPANGSVPV